MSRKAIQLKNKACETSRRLYFLVVYGWIQNAIESTNNIWYTANQSKQWYAKAALYTEKFHTRCQYHPKHLD